MFSFRNRIRVKITVYIWCKAQTPMWETPGMHLFPVEQGHENYCSAHANSWLLVLCVWPGFKVAAFQYLQQSKAERSRTSPGNMGGRTSFCSSGTCHEWVSFDAISLHCWSSSGKAFPRHLCYVLQGFAIPFLIFFSSLKTNNFSLLYLERLRLLNKCLFQLTLFVLRW